VGDFILGFIRLIHQLDFNERLYFSLYSSVGITALDSAMQRARAPEDPNVLP